MTNIVKNIETKSKLEDECRLHPIHAKAMNRFYAPIYKKLIIAVLIIVVLALVLFSGNKAYSYIKGKEKSLKGEITALEKSRDSLFLEVGEREFKIDSVLSIKENNYYSQYRRERRKRITLQNKLKDLEKKEYDREYLDSLAKNIKYAN